MASRDPDRRPSALPMRFKRGDAEAVRRVGERVRRIVGFRGYRIPAVDRQDIEQEVLAQIWRAAGRSGFEAGDGFWGFVDVVTTRRCIDWFRGQRRATPLEWESDVSAPGPGPLQSVLDDERAELARMSVARLKEPCRDLIRLRVVRGQSYRQIAGQLGRSEEALRAQMYRCVRQAREALEELTRGAPASRQSMGEPE